MKEQSEFNKLPDEAVEKLDEVKKEVASDLSKMALLARKNAQV